MHLERRSLLAGLGLAPLKIGMITTLSGPGGYIGQEQGRLSGQAEFFAAQCRI